MTMQIEVRVYMTRNNHEESDYEIISITERQIKEKAFSMVREIHGEDYWDELKAETISMEVIPRK